jgi:hypothetical protein
MAQGFVQLNPRYVERLLVVLVCARLIAGCAAASQPVSESPIAATTSSAPQPVFAQLDLCRLPDLPPTGANGGKSYIIQKVGDGEALKKDCEEIAGDLHQRDSYAIGFVAHTPPNYAPTTIPIALQVPAHDDYLVDAPKWTPAPSNSN